MSNLLTSFQRVDADYEEWAAKVNETTLNEYVEALANSLEEPSNCVQPALTSTHDFLQCLSLMITIFTHLLLYYSNITWVCL
jgi:hypothetical protein